MGEPLVTVVVANAGGPELELLTRVVAAAGFRAHAVEGGPELVAPAVAAQSPGVVLVDLGVANTDAIESLRAHTNQNVSEVRVVTLADGPANGRLAWQAGTDGLLVRPFHVDELRDLLYEVLERPEPQRLNARIAGAQALAGA